MKVEAYLVFSGNDNPSWFKKLLKKNFHNVSVLVRQGSSVQWVGVNTTSRRIRVKSFDFPIEKHLIGSNSVALKVLFDKGLPCSNKAKIFFPPNRCVEVAKMIIGLENMLVMTPYQLYKCIKSGKSKSSGVYFIEEKSDPLSGGDEQ